MKSLEFYENYITLVCLENNKKLFDNIILKVPKREIFVTELFILSDPIWVGGLRNEPKKPFV
jgi:hypothetical protein